MLMKRIIKLTAVFLVFSFVFGLCSFAEGETAPEMIEYGFVDCGDVEIEYGVYGSFDKEPLLLLCAGTAVMMGRKKK